MQFIIKRELYRHCNRRKLKDETCHNFSVNGRLVSEGALLADDIPKSLSSEVLARMRDDQVTKVV